MPPGPQCSIFDKLAVFLNEYLAIGWLTEQVNSRNFWYETSGRARPLRQRFTAHPNLALRGWFWLTKEFGDEEFREVTDPDAEALADIRNHLEHKYLQLHDIGDGSFAQSGPSPPALLLSRTDFEAKTLRLLRYAREGLIFLSLAVQREERSRDAARGDRLAAGLPLYRLDDRYRN